MKSLQCFGLRRTGFDPKPRKQIGLDFIIFSFRRIGLIQNLKKSFHNNFPLLDIGFGLTIKVNNLILFYFLLRQTRFDQKPRK